MTLRRYHAFTLLEVVVAVVIVALLAGATAPVLFRHVADARVAAAKADLSTLSLALEAFALHVGDYPTSDEGLAALVSAPADQAGWRGPYLRGTIPRDPWGREYLYTYQPGESTYELVTRGRDGRAGGSGEDADLSAAEARR